jgi:folate-dependent tRNA-U54 methylase TrmFO/GidA
MISETATLASKGAPNSLAEGVASTIGRSAAVCASRVRTSPYQLNRKLSAALKTVLVFRGQVGTVEGDVVSVAAGTVAVEVVAARTPARIAAGQTGIPEEPLP